MKKYDKSDFKAFAIIAIGIGVMILIGWSSIAPNLSIVASIFR